MCSDLSLMRPLGPGPKCPMGKTALIPVFNKRSFKIKQGNFVFLSKSTRKLEVDFGFWQSRLISVDKFLFKIKLLPPCAVHVVIKGMLLDFNL